MDFGDTPRGLLKVLAPISFGSFQLALALALADYAELYPEVRVQLTLSDHPHGLFEEGVDLALQIGPLADSSLIGRRIADVQLLVCGAPSYFARHPAPVALADLADHNCLRYSQGARRGNWLFKSDGRDVQIKVSGDFEASTGDAVRMAALRGYGLAQLLSYMLREDLAAGRLVRILEEFTPTPTPLHAIYAHRELSATVRLFIAYLEHHFHAQDARLHEL